MKLGMSYFRVNQEVVLFTNLSGCHDVVTAGIVCAFRPVKRLSKRVPILLQCQDHDTDFVMKGCYQ
jgi:hypothetical protein